MDPEYVPLLEGTHPEGGEDIYYNTDGQPVDYWILIELPFLRRRGSLVDNMNIMSPTLQATTNIQISRPQESKGTVQNTNSHPTR